MATIDKADYAARWRALNPETVDRYNARRRVVKVTAVCSSFGQEFERAPSDRRQVCSAFCVKRRRRETDRRARARRAAKEGVGIGRAP
jgi:hypothetical protein